VLQGLPKRTNNSSVLQGLPGGTYKVVCCRASWSYWCSRVL